MDVAQNSIFIALYYIYFKLLMILFLMMLIERGDYLKTNVSCNSCEIITSQFHSDNLRKL